MTQELSDCLYFLEGEGHEKVSALCLPYSVENEKHDCDKLHSYLESKGIQGETLFGSLPTQHQAFKFLGYNYGQFPASEYVGENGLYFGIHQYPTDVLYMGDTLKGYFNEKDTI